MSTTEAPPILTLNNVEVIYDQVALALKGASLEIPQGGMVALLGANGAGKSTLLKSISGLLQAERGEVTRGEIKFLNQTIDQQTPQARVRLGIAQVLEGRRVFEHLTPDENLVAASAVRGGRADMNRLRDLVYSYFPRLAQRRTAESGYLSGGEQQMLAMARILRTGAKLLLLDEITEGLAPVIVRKLGEVISELKKRGFTIIMVEQNFRFAAPLADRHYVLEHGEIIATITREELPDKMDWLHRTLGV